MSLLVSEREDAFIRVQAAAVNLRLQLAQGVTVVMKTTTVEDLVAKFLAYKWSRIRGEWQGKGEAGRNLTLHFQPKRPFDCKQETTSLRLGVVSNR